VRGGGGVVREPGVAGFGGRALQRQLRELSLDASAGKWVARALESGSAAAAFETAATSLARLAALGSTWDRLDQLLLDLATKRRGEGKTLQALPLRPQSGRQRPPPRGGPAPRAPPRAAPRGPRHPPPPPP